MNLESVIQTEASQKEKKNISYINRYVWNLKNCTYEPICKTGIQEQT